MKHFLVTGSTGFIGKNYVNSILSKEIEVSLLTRESSVEKAKKLFPGANILSLDLENGRFNDVDLTSLNSVTDVVHIAGGYDIEMKFKDAYINNILISQNLLQLIKILKGVQAIHLVSSYSVVGNKNNQTFNEDDLCLDEKIMSHYAFSKAKVEEIFRSSASRYNLKLRIYRPGIVIESRAGMLMEKIDGPYYFSKIILKFKNFIKPLIFLVLPFSRQARIPLVSIESLTKNLVQATLNPSEINSTRSYYFFSNVQVGVENLIFGFLKNLDIQTKIIPMVKLKSLKKITNYLGVPIELFEFLYMKNEYKMTNREVDLPCWEDEKLDPNNLAKIILSSTPESKQEVADA